MRECDGGLGRFSARHHSTARRTRYGCHSRPTDPRKQRPYDGWVLAVLLLDQLAAILVILAAAWLVWTRPGSMTWGFFLYVIWFNPGQSAQYYALLQLYSPIALLTQNLVGAIAQGAGLAGFIWFALRAPTDETTARWRPI